MDVNCTTTSQRLIINWDIYLYKNILSAFSSVINQSDVPFCNMLTTRVEIEIQIVEYSQYVVVNKVEFIPV